MNKGKVFMMICLVSISSILTAPPVKSGNLLKMAAPLLDTGGTVIDARDPEIKLISGKGTDRVDIAWLNGSDGKTPLEKVVHEIHLSETEKFTPGADTLKKTVKGTGQETGQIEIDD